MFITYDWYTVYEIITIATISKSPTMQRNGMSHVGKSGSGRDSRDFGTPSISSTSSLSANPPVKRENDLLKQINGNVSEK